ncbi:MAG: HAD family hydrolase [Synechococcales bacterium]|nr:HAD family hydrolase [Synechococcales bacterium]
MRFTVRCNEVVFEQVQAIVFDKDGTLADSREFLKTLGQRRSRLIDAQVPGVQEPLRLAFGLEEGYLNPAGLLAVGTRRENEIAAAAYVAETGRGWIESLHIAESAFAEADVYMQRKAENTPLFDGARSCLQQLSAAGVALALLSADTPQQVKDFVEFNELTPYFQQLVGSDTAIGKRDPELLRQLCDRLGVPCQSVLVIGDSPLDIEIAQAVGAVGCVGVTWGWGTAEHLAAADVLIDSFEQLSLV